MSLFDNDENITNSETGEYDIYQFLRDHKVEKGQSFTHLSMGLGNFAGSFYIRESELDVFYRLYENAIFADKILYLVEKHEEYGPVLVDFDFKYEYEIHERLHTREHVQQIVELYMNEIHETFEIEKDDPRMTAFVFERPKPYKSKGSTKDGIHIVFPFIVSNPDVQYMIRNAVLLKIAPVLSNLPLKNALSDVIDKSIIFSNGWMMFGSRKPKCDPYVLNSIYDGNLESIPIDAYDYGTRDLPRFFSIRGRKAKDLIPVRQEKMESLEKMIQKKKTQTNTSLKSKIGMNVNYDVQQLSEIVRILSIERTESYTTWMEVGWALHNIDPNSQELLDLWIEFSQRSPKFVDGECEREWMKMKSTGLGIGSLYYWAKIDNYERYRNIMDRDINQLLIKSLDSVTNFDCANVLYKIYRYEFKYSNNEWYMFMNHLWHPMKEATELRQKISTELVVKYMTLISDFNLKAVSDDPEVSEEEKEEYKKKAKKGNELIIKLKTTSFKADLIRECKDLFYDKDFYNKLDTNLYLIGFTNGIYDLEKMELRDGRPDDYVSMCTGIEKIEFSKDHEQWENLQYFLSTVHPNQDIKNYFLTFLATCLQGHNAEEKFRIWTGVGGNGKSKIIELFVSAYGEYTCKLPITLLTGARAASNACTPEILQLKGKRFAYLEEPDEGQKLNVGLMKEITGGDKIKARGLNKDPIEFKPQFKLSCLCNDVPEVPPNDIGTWRRMEIIEFKSRFVNNPREPNEFLIDDQLSIKMKHWSELFIALLVDVYFVNYKNHGIIVPTEINKFTEEFQKQCDNYIEFIMEATEDTNNRDSEVPIGELHDEFRLWYVEENNDHKVPSKIEFRKYLKKRYKDRANAKTIKGLKFKDDYNKRTEGRLVTLNAPTNINIDRVH